MACRLARCVDGALAAAHGVRHYERSRASPATASPTVIMDCVEALAPLLLGPVRAALICEALDYLTSHDGLDVTCCCGVTALLQAAAASDGDHTAAVVDDDREHARLLCAKLWDVLVVSTVTTELECAGCCVARLYPAYGAIIVDAALDALRGGGSDPNVGAMSSLTAIEVIGFTSQTVARHRDSQWAHVATQRFIDAALACVANKLNASTIPSVTRRILIPLLPLSPSSSHVDDGEYSSLRRVIDLAKSLYAQGQLSEAIVLIASLFDVIFPPPAAVSVASSDVRKDPFLWQLLLLSMSCGPATVMVGTTKLPALHSHAAYLLKRLVSYTSASIRFADGAVVRFTDEFFWAGTESTKAWDQYFLIFDSLNEYGLHIVAPALERLNALLTMASNNVIPFAWIETLFDKAIHHPNVGVRKLGLGCLWGLPFPLLAARFSVRLVCQAAFTAACDPRICAEYDKIALPGSFLDCRAAQGKPCHDMLPIQPVAERCESFYVGYLQATDSVEERRSRLGYLLTAVRQSRIARFGVCMTVRLLKRLSDCFDLGLGSVELLATLESFVASEVEGKHSFWLESRIDAILIDAVLNFVASSTDNIAFSPAFLSVIARLSSCGLTGGDHLAAVDLCGAAPPIGGGITHDELSRRLDHAIDAESNHVIRALMYRYQLTRESISAIIDRDAIVDPVIIRQRIMLVKTTMSSDALHDVVSRVSMLGQQTSMDPRRQSSTMLLFAELAAALPEWLSGPATDIPLLRSVFESVLTVARAELSRCAVLARDPVSAATLRDAEWFNMSASKFDIVAAAVFQALRRMRPLHAAATPFPVVARALGDLLLQLPQLLGEKSRVPDTATEYALTIVIRNTARLAQTMLAVSSDAEWLGPWVQHLGGVSAVTRIIRSLFELPSLHLSSADVPNPLCSSAGWGLVIEQYGRYVSDVVVQLLHSLDVTMDIPDADLVAYVLDRAHEWLDTCSQSNLSAAFDVASWALQHTESIHDSAATSLLRVMTLRLADDSMRRERHKCMALLAFALQRVELSVARPASLRAAAGRAVMGIISNPESSDRMLLCLAEAMCAAVVVGGTPVYDLYEEKLLHLAILLNTHPHEEELDACLACTEPLISSDYWNNLRSLRPPSIDAASVARAAGVSAILYAASTDPALPLRVAHKLLEWNASHPDLTSTPCMPDSGGHRCRIRLWQLMCSLVPLLRDAHDWASVLQRLVKEALEVTNMGSVRRYMELVLIAGMNRHPRMYPLIAEKLLDPALRAQICGSYVLAAIHLVKRHGLQHDALREALLPLLVRHCASHFHVVRIMCQIGLHFIGTHCGADLSATLSVDAKAVVDLVESSAECRKFRDRHLDVVVFDDEKAMMPFELFCVQRKEGDVWLSESVAPSIFDRVAFAFNELCCLLGTNSPIERQRCRRLLNGIEEPLMRLRALPVVPHSPSSIDRTEDFLRYASAFDMDHAAATISTSKPSAPNAESCVDNLQRKISSWWTSEVHNELHPRALGTRHRQRLIIVATLIDIPVNIAGLCRCAEVFAAERVVVADRKIFQNAQFVTVARSAELWLPWEEVPPVALPEYLNDMRRLGYTIAGVEQTADSVPLHSYKFPSQTVLVLGAEGTGIPATLLPFLDTCLEIPQFGLIRSLNVHVTGAVAMYECTKQLLMQGDRVTLDAEAPLPIMSP